MRGSGALTLIQLNDSHAYLEPHQELFWSAGGASYAPAGGYAKIAAILADVRKEKPGEVLAFDCGDTVHGTFPAVDSRGGVCPPILDALGFEAMSAHWEFAYGPARFHELAAVIDYPVLAVNCYESETGEPAFTPYRVCEAGGLRVGVVGIASNIVDKVMPETFSEGLRFTLGRDELAHSVRVLREEEKADVIVVISHLGLPQDTKLAGEVSGIDVLLSGHTHDRLYEPVIVDGAIIIQSGCHGSFLGRIDLEIESGRVVDWEHELITVGEETAPDPDVQARIDEVMRAHRGRLDEVVGRTETALNRNTVLEATMDNFLLQSLIGVTGAELAFSNGWRYGAPVPPGPVTMNDLYNIIPVDPPVSTTELTGEEVRVMMEENLERTFSADPYQQMGGYVKRCLGLKLYARLEDPEGRRIQELFIGDGPAVAERVYPTAFVTSQGVPMKYGRNRQETGVAAIEALRQHLSRGPVEAGLMGTVTLV